MNVSGLMESCCLSYSFECVEVVMFEVAPSIVLVKFPSRVTFKSVG